MKVLYLVDLAETPEALGAWREVEPQLRKLDIESEFALLTDAGGAPDGWPGARCFDWGTRPRELRRALRALAAEVAPKFVHSTGMTTNFLMWRSCKGLDALLVGSVEKSPSLIRPRFGRLGTFLRCSLPGIQAIPDAAVASEVADLVPKMIWPWILTTELPGRKAPEEVARQLAAAYFALRRGNPPKWKKPT